MVSLAQLVDLAFTEQSRVVVQWNSAGDRYFTHTFSPFAVDQPGTFAWALSGVFVLIIDVVRAVRQRSKAEAIRQPVREVIRLQLQPQRRGSGSEDA